LLKNKGLVRPEPALYFQEKTPQNVGGERKNEIFSLSSHTLLSSYAIVIFL
jgi:hypothetical protein